MVCIYTHSKHSYAKNKNKSFLKGRVFEKATVCWLHCNRELNACRRTGGNQPKSLVPFPSSTRVLTTHSFLALFSLPSFGDTGFKGHHLGEEVEPSPDSESVGALTLDFPASKLLFLYSISCSSFVVVASIDLLPVSLCECVRHVHGCVHRAQQRTCPVSALSSFGITLRRASLIESGLKLSQQISVILLSQLSTVLGLQMHVAILRLSPGCCGFGLSPYTCTASCSCSLSLLSNPDFTFPSSWNCLDLFNTMHQAARLHCNLLSS